MNRLTRLLCGVVMVAATMAAPAAPASAAAAACQWRPTALPLPANAISGAVTTTDHQGGYGGYAEFAGTNQTHLVSWKNGTVTDYGRIPSSMSKPAADQNRAGTIVGREMVGSRPTNIRWRAGSTRGGQWGLLPEPAGAKQSAAQYINDRGDIVGFVWLPGRVDVPVLWPAARPTEVVELAGLTANTLVHGLDEDGTVLVDIGSGSTPRGSHLWRNGVLTALRRPPLVDFVRGFDISNGRVVGWAVVDLLGVRRDVGVLWDRDGTPSILSSSTMGHAINRDGLSIGETGSGDAVWRMRTFEASLGTTAAVNAATVGDDGSIGGHRVVNGQKQPTVWRCT